MQGGKTSPAHVHMSWKKTSSMKNSFDIFEDKSETRYFETGSQMNLEDSLQTNGVQKLLKKRHKSFIRESAG